MNRHSLMLFGALVFGDVTLAAQAPGRWITNTFAPLPQPEEEYTAVVASDRLYLIGGNRGGRKEWPRHVVEYDLAANRWTSKKPAPFSGDHMAAAAMGGKIYVFGGQGEGGVNKPLNTAWEYDPAADAWKALAPMPSGRTAAAAVESGGRIYVIGGNTVGGLTVTTNDVYDPAANRWESRAAMPTPRSGHGWTTYQGRIYVAGGEVRNSHMDAIFRDVEVFDPAVNDWYTLPPMPTARHGVNLAAFGTRLHAIGGHTAFAAGGGAAMHTPANEAFEFAGR